jgi:hypothetical protein
MSVIVDQSTAMSILYQIALVGHRGKGCGPPGQIRGGNGLELVRGEGFKQADRPPNLGPKVDQSTITSKFCRIALAGRRPRKTWINENSPSGLFPDGLFSLSRQYPNRDVSGPQKTGRRFRSRDLRGRASRLQRQCLVGSRTRRRDRSLVPKETTSGTRVSRERTSCEAGPLPRLTFVELPLPDAARIP